MAVGATGFCVTSNPRRLQPMAFSHDPLRFVRADSGLDAGDEKNALSCVHFVSVLLRVAADTTQD